MPHDQIRTNPNCVSRGITQHGATQKITVCVNRPRTSAGCLADVCLLMAPRFEKKKYSKLTMTRYVTVQFVLRDEGKDDIKVA
jgi:hypothetical protein